MNEELPQNLFNDPEIQKRDADEMAKKQRDIKRQLEKRKEKNDVYIAEKSDGAKELPFNERLDNALKKLSDEIEQRMTDTDGYDKVALDLDKSFYSSLAKKFAEHGPDKLGLALHDIFSEDYASQDDAEKDMQRINLFLEKLGVGLRVMVIESTMHKAHSAPTNYKITYVD